VWIFAGLSGQQEMCHSASLTEKAESILAFEVAASYPYMAARRNSRPMPIRRTTFCWDGISGECGVARYWRSAGRKNAHTIFLAVNFTGNE